MKTTNISCPEGTAGLAVEPWSKGEIYAVAADWRQASAPVYVYGRSGWDLHPAGLQVADFRHSDRRALAAVIADAMQHDGCGVDDDDVAEIVATATRIK